jgi:hypothetical protein
VGSPVERKLYSQALCWVQEKRYGCFGNTKGTSSNRKVNVGQISSLFSYQRSLWGIDVGNSQPSSCHQNFQCSTPKRHDYNIYLLHA